MRICFIKTGKSFLPEIYAYDSYLKSKGIDSIICNDEKEAYITNADLYYRFGGLLYKKINKNIPEIHEYNTVSTGGFPIFKNMIKSIFSMHSDCFVFLSEFVENEYFFYRIKNKIYRDMGADDDFISVRKSKKIKRFDVTYIGSISTRIGLVDKIIGLAEKGLKISLVGNVFCDDKKKLDLFENITVFGVLNRREIINVISESKFGLNYTPDIYPYNRQTSTKVIEYLVAGLPVISNRYNWIDEHSYKLNYSYLDIDSIKGRDDLVIRSNFLLDNNTAQNMTWSNILDNCGFYNFCINSASLNNKK